MDWGLATEDARKGLVETTLPRMAMAKSQACQGAFQQPANARMGNGALTKLLEPLC
jgi:hypothetical protein